MNLCISELGQECARPGYTENAIFYCDKNNIVRPDHLCPLPVTCIVERRGINDHCLYDDLKVQNEGDAKEKQVQIDM